MRKIIHVDMDCFYAAVEMRDNPALRDIPIAIGGSSDRRGVISTCNYPARKFGVRSAMATAYAMKLCPNLTLVKGRMEVYVNESQKIRSIFSDYTDLIEPLSLDEAYLDVTHSQFCGGSATLMAEEIRARIKSEIGLTASAGVAPCKFVAKVASDENKPDGICVITPDKLDEFVRQLPLKKIPGVGKVTMQKLQRLGLNTCEDVRRYPFERIQKELGKFGSVLWERAHGIDERSLSVSRERKSIGVERTLSEDIHTLDECKAFLPHLLEKLQSRIDNHGKRTGKPVRLRTQGVKLKFNDFQLTTVEHRQGKLDERYFHELMEEAFERANGRGIRLVGLHIGLAAEQSTHQLILPFDE
ncbi:DNA polymerase IV [Alteromonas sp. KUL42]|uniref:DNA polymerase IV n=1 Tax=Alteromonas sp. KUL42 TaxID=2480797 RepID=UPI001035A595|nr:DNA polymerase IV [Alteromonas sp. KUL42]TAP33514.1 DNA polymerase IV [Alteromonas sp. KUL42]GEA08379.1 DNA polymerase IV [Alteromonas sp. KUL42]